MKKMIISSTLILSMTAFLINFCACGNKAEETCAPEHVAQQEPQEQQSEMMPAEQPAQAEEAAAETRAMGTGEVVELSSDAQFNELIAKGNVVVDFYAVWCGPCKALAPVLHDLAGSNRNIMFVKINTEKFPSLSSQYNVKSIPTLIFFKDGKKVATEKGAHSKGSLQSKLNSVFGK